MRFQTKIERNILRSALENFGVATMAAEAIAIGLGRGDLASKFTKVGEGLFILSVMA